MRVARYYVTTLCASIGILCCLSMGAFAQQKKSTGQKPSTKLARLKSAFRTDRWVTYTPTELDPRPAHFRRASAQGIETDLRILRPYFDVLMTYSCSAEQGVDQVTPIAAKLGFRVCLGIWDVKSVVEIERAISLARQYPATVLAIIVGNETQLAHRATWEELEAAIRVVRAALPGLPISTSEPISAYGNEDLRRVVDFHAPNAHYIFASNDRQNVPAAVAWLKERVRSLQDLPYGSKPVLIKEHGFPNGPAPFSPELQARYWTAWKAAQPPSEKCATAFFESFCAPWKVETNPSPDLGPSEAFWGAWDEKRLPKAVVKTFAHVSPR